MKQLFSSLALVALLAVGLTGCKDDPVSPPIRIGYLSASDTAIDFGTIAFGESRDTTIYLRNAGDKDVALTAFTFNSAEFSLVGIAMPTLVKAGDSTMVVLRYTPDDVHGTTASLEIRSDAKDTVVTIVLVGNASQRVAGVGSTFTFDNSADTAGVPKGETVVTVSEVTAKDVTWQSRSNITLIRELADSSYFDFLPDGDVALWFEGFPTPGDPIPHGTGWIRAQFATKTPVDTVYREETTIQTFPAVIRIFTEYLGPDTTQVGTERIPVEKVKLTVRVTVTFLGVPFSRTDTQTMYYAPRLGYLTRMEGRTTSDIPTQERNEGTLKVLTRYTIQ